MSCCLLFLPTHTTRRTTNFNFSYNQVSFSSDRVTQHPPSIVEDKALIFQNEANKDEQSLSQRPLKILYVEQTENPNGTPSFQTQQSSLLETSHLL